jgi:hypothetical protein
MKEFVHRGRVSKQERVWTAMKSARRGWSLTSGHAPTQDKFSVTQARRLCSGPLIAHQAVATFDSIK